MKINRNSPTLHLDIKRFRESQGLTKQEFGDRIGTNPRVVAAWESDRSLVSALKPSQKKVDKINTVFGLTDITLHEATNEQLMEELQSRLGTR
jgi:transcriptional regulator with XRE-family HTH domain